MNTLSRTNLSLVAIIALLYCLLNLPEQTVPDRLTLSSLHAQDVSDIIIERQNRGEIQLHKKDQQWLVQHPLYAPANHTRIKLLLNVLSQPSYSQYQVSPELDLQQFGLEPASLILRLNQQSFSFGGTEGLSQRRYIQHRGTIHLIDDTVSPLLNSSATSFIDNRLFGDNMQLTQLRLPLVSTQSTTSLEQASTLKLIEGHWSSDTTMSSDQLSTLVANWQHAYALQVTTVSDEQPVQENSHKLLFSFKGVDEEMEVFAHIEESTLVISNPRNRLRYHFPLALAQQLFINKE